MVDHSPQSLEAREILPGKLYFVCRSKLPRSNYKCHFFSVGEEFVYIPFFQDFGPLNLGHTVRFGLLVEQLLHHPTNVNRMLCFVASPDAHSAANACFLISSYMLLFHHKTADEAFAPIADLQLTPFRDAAPGPNTYPLGVLDFLQGLAKAREVGFLDLDNFDLEEYDFYEQVENGDLSWVLPNKLIAFCGPTHKRMDSPEHGFTLMPEDYVEYFVARNVTAVVRLNKKMYDKKRFTKNGIHHYDMYFPDGDSPPSEILCKFLEVCESEKGALAVHCKAGLGRTGTLNGAYMMKHYGFTAKECITWMRICRPGTVIGPQQQFLESIQEEMWEEGRKHREALLNPPPKERVPPPPAAASPPSPAHNPRSASPRPASPALSAPHNHPRSASARPSSPALSTPAHANARPSSPKPTNPSPNPSPSPASAKPASHSVRSSGPRACPSPSPSPSPSPTPHTPAHPRPTPHTPAHPRQPAAASHPRPQPRAASPPRSVARPSSPSRARQPPPHPNHATGPATPRRVASPLRSRIGGAPVRKDAPVGRAAGGRGTPEPAIARNGSGGAGDAANGEHNGDGANGKGKEGSPSQQQFQVPARAPPPLRIRSTSLSSLPTKSTRAQSTPRGGSPARSRQPANSMIQPRATTPRRTSSPSRLRSTPQSAPRPQHPSQQKTNAGDAGAAIGAAGGGAGRGRSRIEEGAPRTSSPRRWSSPQRLQLGPRASTPRPSMVRSGLHGRMGPREEDAR